MRIRFFALGLATLGLVAGLAACKKEGVDTQKPTISLKAPAHGAKLEIGHEEGVHFDVEFSDNEALKSYKVDIHSNFTPHSHTHLRAGEPAKAFSFNRSWELPRQRNASVHHHEIKIPAGVKEGAYHLMVHCTDAAGNESHVVVEVQLVHEGGDQHHHDR